MPQRPHVQVRVILRTQKGPLPRAWVAWVAVREGGVKVPNVLPVCDHINCWRKVSWITVGHHRPPCRPRLAAPGWRRCTIPWGAGLPRGSMRTVQS